VGGGLRPHLTWRLNSPANSSDLPCNRSATVSQRTCENSSHLVLTIRLQDIRVAAIHDRAARKYTTCRLVHEVIDVRNVFMFLFMHVFF